MDLLSFSVCANECETTINFSERISPLYSKQERLIFWIRYVYFPKIPSFHGDDDDVIITVWHCLFLLHSLKPEVNDNKSETIVSFSKESGKKVIDPG